MLSMFQLLVASFAVRLKVVRRDFFLECMNELLKLNLLTDAQLKIVEQN